MIPEDPRIERIRQRLFDKRCKKVTVDQTLYHGTPLDGLHEIKRCGRIIPQEHGILPGEWFCVSPNDNMLRFFADDRNGKMHGMVFEMIGTPLNCLQLDHLHFSLACWENGCAIMDDVDARDIELAERLGYSQHRGDIGMSESELRRLLPDDCDGVIFPWTGITYWSGELHPSAHNDECEIALTERGCEKVWRALDQLVINDEWHPKRQGWRKLSSIMRGWSKA